jgi:hypothetical protein
MYYLMCARAFVNANQNDVCSANNRHWRLKSLFGAKEDAAIAGLSLAWLALQSGEPQVAWTQAAKAIADGLKENGR